VELFSQESNLEMLVHASAVTVLLGVVKDPAWSAQHDTAGSLLLQLIETVCKTMTDEEAMMPTVVLNLEHLVKHKEERNDNQFDEASDHVFVSGEKLTDVTLTVSGERPHHIMTCSPEFSSLFEDPDQKMRGRGIQAISGTRTDMKLLYSILAHAELPTPGVAARKPELLSLYDAVGKSHTLGVKATKNDADEGLAKTLIVKLERTRFVNPEAADDAEERRAKVKIDEKTLEVVTVSKGFTEMYGFIANEVRGKILDEVIWDDEKVRKESWLALLEGARGGKRMQGQLATKHAKGWPITVDVMVSPVGERGQHVTDFLVTFEPRSCHCKHCEFDYLTEDALVALVKVACDTSPRNTKCAVTAVRMLCKLCDDGNIVQILDQHQAIGDLAALLLPASKRRHRAKNLAEDDKPTIQDDEPLEPPTRPTGVRGGPPGRDQGFGRAPTTGGTILPPIGRLQSGGSQGLTRQGSVGGREGLSRQGSIGGRQGLSRQGSVGQLSRQGSAVDMLKRSGSQLLIAVSTAANQLAVMGLTPGGSKLVMPVLKLLKSVSRMRPAVVTNADNAVTALIEYAAAPDHDDKQLLAMEILAFLSSDYDCCGRIIEWEADVIDMLYLSRTSCEQSEHEAHLRWCSMIITNLRAHHAALEGSTESKRSAKNDLAVLMKEDDIWGSDPSARLAMQKQYTSGPRKPMSRRNSAAPSGGVGGGLRRPSQDNGSSFGDSRSVAGSYHGVGP